MLPRTMRVSCSVWLSLLLCCGLVLSGLPQLAALEEGDSCSLKGTIAGICRVSSECEPHIDKYIKSGRLSINDVPTCGLGPREEIVCCPVAPCCPDDTSPRQVPSTTVSTTKTTTTTTTTTTTRKPATKNVIDLDTDSAYFDFQQLLNPKKPKNPTNNNNNRKPSIPAAIPTARNKDQFQTVGPLGPATDADRQPKVINRPQSFSWPPQEPQRWSQPVRKSDDLIQKVNDRLRQQGMNIMPSREVSTFDQRPAPTERTTARPIADFNSDPWAPFRFRPSPVDELITNDLGNGDAKLFGTESTTTPRTIQPTPTTRVDTAPGSERAAVRACRQIEERQNLHQLTPHILDGIPVEDGIYPHMAAIAFTGIGRTDYRCGGSLITTRHVLTAAHCVNSFDDTPVHVRLGTVNIDQVNNHYQDIPLTGNITIHPDYVSSSKYNDIAILELAEEAKLSFYIYPACLETNPVDPPADSKLFVAGWGVMNLTNRRTSKILLRAPLNIVSLEQCNVSFAEQPNSRRFLANGVVNTLLCAADEVRQKADACQGDSGGPLVIERDIVNNKYSILGIISAGFGCATKTPGLYTRVAAYLDFIESVVWPNNVV